MLSKAKLHLCAHVFDAEMHLFKVFCFHKRYKQGTHLHCVCLCACVHVYVCVSLG